MAAALVAKVARLSGPEWPEAGGATAQAQALRERAAMLAHSDAAAYEEALRTLAEKEDVDPARRDAAIGGALARAADVPLMIAVTACDVALLAADVAEGGKAEASADAAAAALLAEGAARSAGHLVDVNLATAPDDPRTARGADVVAAAAAAARRALAATA